MAKSPRKVKMAIAYDFDGTLAPGNMQERDFIPELGLKPSEFWDEVKGLSKKHDMDEILAYLNLMLKKANDKEIRINKSSFADYGKKLTFFPGVVTWFDRINDYAQQQQVSLEHYVISSGLREMVAGTSIRKHFKQVFASGFRYDQHDAAIWPALAINYTNKTQYLFRINKGIANAYDNSTINKFTPQQDRPVPFGNMLYIGDGETDIPAMKMMTYQGGRAIAVYPPRLKFAKQKAEELIKNERANLAVIADYRDQKPLDKAVKAVIDIISAQHRFKTAAR